MSQKMTFIYKGFSVSQTPNNIIALKGENVEKELELSLYKDGYHIDETDCWHMPLACAAGYYDMYYYQMFLFYTTIQNNWKKEVVDLENINRFGLDCISCKVTEKDHLIPTIREYINRQVPVILKVHYNTLFFAYDQYKRSNLEHGILIAGYDDSREIIQTREWAHNYTNYPELNGGGLPKLWLADHIIEKMAWDSADKFFGEPYVELVSVEENYELVSIPTVKDAIEEWIVMLEEKESNLAKVLINFNEAMQNKQSFDMKKFISTYINSLHIPFDIVGKYVDANEVKQFEQFFISGRKQIVQTLIKFFISKVKLSSDELGKYQALNIKLDSELKSFLMKMKEQM